MPDETKSEPLAPATDLWEMRDGVPFLVVRETEGDDMPVAPHFGREQWIALYRERRRQGFPLTRREIERMRELAPEVLAADGIVPANDQEYPRPLLSSQEGYG